MHVELIAYSMPFNSDLDKNGFNPIDIVEQCASVCYDSEPDYCSHRIAKSCAKSGHMSVYEHVYFTFHVVGISRACLAQLTRHRHFSPSVRSQRYCSEGEQGAVMPDALNDEQSEILAQAYKDSFDKYNVLCANGAKKEDARMALPNGCMTELYMSMNARALIESSHLRLCNNAQKEIRDLYIGIKTIVMSVSPEIGALMVPKCEVNKNYPFCTERKGCGKHPQLSEVYGKCKCNGNCEVKANDTDDTE